MRLRGLAIGTVLLVAAGCSTLQRPTAPSAPLVKPPASAAEALEMAHERSERGHWAAAISILDQAIRAFPDAAELPQRRADYVARSAQIEHVLEDQILVGDAENERHKIALLEKLSRVDPNDLVLASRLLYWREGLANKVERLTRCSESHVEDTPVLAKRCFEIASAVATEEDVQRRLADVGAQLRSSETAAAEQRRVNVQNERRLRAKVLLGNARAAIEARDYRRALDLLAKVAELQPGNREVADLQQQAWAMISPQVEALVKLGDHLYLDEQLDAAVATWQAALGLKPGDEEIAARIERAKTVLHRLESLRRQQNTPDPVD